MKMVVLRGAVACAATAVVGGFGLAAQVSAQLSEPASAVSAYTMTPERLVASTAALLALIGAVAGGLGLVRSVRRIGKGGRRGAFVALVLGPIGLVVGSVIVVTADGGLGTGNGLAGGVVAMVLGVIGMAFSGLALARSRRPG